MDKTYYKIIGKLSLLLAMLASCNKEAADPHPKGTEIRIIEPMIFNGGTSGAVETRAATLGDGTNCFYTPPPLTTLPVGTTVWLTYRLKNADDSWNTPNLQAYVVQNSAGYNALYPCKSTEDGDGYLTVDDPVTTTTPLYLEDGTYQFRMVAPANKINKSTLSMQVENGMYLYSNDERYNETASEEIVVASSGSGVQNIVLNPMIHQMARIKIKMNKGVNVYNMEMMPDGIEISGLQNPEEDTNGLKFDWSSLSVADTLVMKKADKYTRVYMKEFTYNDDGSIEGDIGILPTDCMSTQMVLLFNIAVNGIPTQYVLTLKERKFRHGHSYNMNLSIGLDGNITVMSWANQSWTGELDI